MSLSENGLSNPGFSDATASDFPPVLWYMPQVKKKLEAEGQGGRRNNYRYVLNY